MLAEIGEVAVRREGRDPGEPRAARFRSDAQPWIAEDLNASCDERLSRQQHRRWLEGQPGAGLGFGGMKRQFFPKKTPAALDVKKMAEGAGFEPAVRITPRSISSRVP